ncbi:hypothetical protein N9Y92_02530 [Chlamydiales bacterium]|nr:hypothetical protein [Chlamydiales bacterium]
MTKIIEVKTSVTTEIKRTPDPTVVKETAKIFETTLERIISDLNTKVKIDDNQKILPIIIYTENLLSIKKSVEAKDHLITLFKTCNSLTFDHLPFCLLPFNIGGHANISINICNELKKVFPEQEEMEGLKQVLLGYQKLERNPREALQCFLEAARLPFAHRIFSKADQQYINSKYSSSSLKELNILFEKMRWEKMPPKSFLWNKFLALPEITFFFGQKIREKRPLVTQKQVMNIALGVFAAHELLK